MVIMAGSAQPEQCKMARVGQEVIQWNVRTDRKTSNKERAEINSKLMLKLKRFGYISTKRNVILRAGNTGSFES